MIKRFVIVCIALVLGTVFPPECHAGVTPPDSLNILLLGHSYGVDCTEHLPALLKEAGIANVRIGRFIKGNCSLEERWNLAFTPAVYLECAPGETEYGKRQATMPEILGERPWDIVIFQTSLENEGRYETIQPWLDRLIGLIREESLTRYGRSPELWWNCFWPISVLLEGKPENERATYRLGFYGGSSRKMYKAYVKTARKVVRRTAVSHIIPSGATIMALRSSSLNEPGVKEFTRDGYHLSFGAGRYAAACTFFESLITPRYGVSVVGNTLRLPDLVTPVTDGNAEALQQAARRSVRGSAAVRASKRYDVYLLIGQSNMAGRGKALAADSLAVEGVYLLDGEGKVIPATVPYNIHSTIRKNAGIQGVNPGVAFAAEMHRRTGRRILLVVNARGGTGLDQWLKDAPQSNFFKSDDIDPGQPMPQFYAEAVRRTKQALKYGRLKGILWHQGEADSKPEKADTYLERLSRFVADLRHDIPRADKVPFIAGETVREFSRADIINPVLMRIPEVIPRSAVVSSEGCEANSDNVHFSRSGQLLLGRRYAEALLRFQ